VTGNDLQIIVGQNRIREAETLHRIGNLPNLPALSVFEHCDPAA
jgi:hypothetical protein